MRNSPPRGGRSRVGGRLAALTALAALIAGGTSWPALALDKPPPAAAGTDSTTPTAANGANAVQLAQIQARSTGQAVVVDALTSATQTTTAAPDGSLSTHTDTQPVRLRRGGAWIPLDASLAEHSGTVTPNATTDPVVLSDGGTGPLATLTDASGHTLSLTLPFTLPAPTLTGASALYSAVLPGVDLEVVIDPQGGFSDVLIVHDAQAAANPDLAKLTIAAQGQGLTLQQQGTNIAAVTADGTVSYIGPQPMMWDSSTNSTSTASPSASATAAPSASAASSASASTTAPSTAASASTAPSASASVSEDPSTAASAIPSPTAGTAANTQAVTQTAMLVHSSTRKAATTTAVDASATGDSASTDSSGQSAGPTTSSAQQPGTGAQVAPVAVAASSTGVMLTPDQSLLHSSNVKFPVFIDPTLSATTVGYKFDQLYYDSSCSGQPEVGVTQDYSGEGVGYQHWGSSCGNSIERSMFELDTSKLTKAMKVSKAEVNFTETYAAACSNSAGLTLYNMPEMNSGSDANNTAVPGSSSQVATTTVTSHSNSTCSGAPVAFDVTNEVAGFAGTIPNWTFEVRNQSETESTSNNDFLRLSENPTIDITYDEAPTTATTSHTIPAGTAGSASTCNNAGTTWLSAGTQNNIRLSTVVYSPLGEAVRARYHIWDTNKKDTSTGGETNEPDRYSVYVSPGTAGSQTLGYTAEDGHRYGWSVQAQDGTLSSGWLSYCYFAVDLTPPTTPTFATNTAFPPLSSGQTGTGVSGINNTATFTVTANDPAPTTDCTYQACHQSGISKFIYSIGQDPTLTSGTSVTTVTDKGNGTVSATFKIPVNTAGVYQVHVKAVDRAGNPSQNSGTYIFYAPWDPNAKVAPGDVDGDGKPDLLTTDSAGNLIMRSGGSPSTTAVQVSSAAQSPDGTSWTSFQVVHRGSLHAKSWDDLYAFQTKTHVLYEDENDEAAKGTAAPGFTQVTGKGAQAVLKMPCIDPKRCQGYDSSWRTTTQIAAPGSVFQPQNDFADLITMENGKLWLYQGGSGGTITGSILLGDGDWSRMTLITPSTVGGVTTLWARDNTTGVIYAYPLPLSPVKVTEGSSTNTKMEPPLLHAPKAAGPLKISVQGSTLCMDDYHSSTTPGGVVDIYTCNGSAAQNWVLGTDGTVRALGMCLDVSASGTANGTKVDEYACNGTGAQQWKPGPNGQLVNPESGKCLGDPGATTTVGTQLILWTCYTTAQGVGDGSQDWNNGTTSALPTSTVQPIGYASPATYPIVTSLGDVTGPSGTPDGKPDLYLINSTGTVNLDQGITSPGAQINAQDPTDTAKNQWALDEGAGATTAADTGSASVDAAQKAAYTSTGITWAKDTTLTTADTNNAGANPTGTTPTFTNGTGYLAVPGADRLITTGSYTVSAWVKLTSDAGTDEWAVGQSSTTHQAFYLGYHETGKTWGFMTTTSNTNPAYPLALSTLGAATLGKWTHLVGVYDIDGTMSLYVDGQLAATATNTTPVFDQNSTVSVGAITYTGSTSPYQPFYGSVSDVRLYQTAFGPETALAAPATDGTLTTADTASQQLNNTVPNPAPAALDRNTWKLQGADSTGAAADAGQENEATGPDNATVLQANQPATFNGTTDYLGTQAPALDTTKSFTLSIQATQPTTAPAATADILCQGDSTTNGFCLGDSGPGTPWFFQMADTNTPTSPPQVSNSTLWNLNGTTEPEYGSDGTTDTLTAVYDASASPHTMTLYVNGCPAGTHTVTTPAFSTTTPLTIGAATTSPTNAFTGQLSNLEVYPYALASTELPGGCSPKGTPLISDPGQIPNNTIVEAPDYTAPLVVEAGFGFPITTSDITADHYDTSTIEGVTDAVYLGLTQTLQSDGTTPTPKILGDGTLLTDASTTDPNTYIVTGGALATITPTDWTAGTYTDSNGDTPIPAPTSWITAHTAANPADYSLITDATGADTTTYMIIQGVAAPVTSDEASNFGLSTSNSVPVPPTWITKEKAHTPPVNTLFYDIDTGTYDLYTLAGIYQLTDSDLSSGTYDLTTAISAPDTLIKEL